MDRSSSKSIGKTRNSVIFHQKNTCRLAIGKAEETDRGTETERDRQTERQTDRQRGGEGGRRTLNTLKRDSELHKKFTQIDSA